MSIPFPKSLKKNPKMTCVVGLTAEAERLVDIRKNRMITLKENKKIQVIQIFKILKKKLRTQKKLLQNISGQQLMLQENQSRKQLHR